MASKRKRLNPRRRAEKKPAVEGKVIAAYFVPRENRTLHISEVIKKITDGEAIKIVPTNLDLIKDLEDYGKQEINKAWFDEAKDMSEEQMTKLLRSNPVTTGFISTIEQPDWVADVVKEAFKRAEHGLT